MNLGPVLVGIDGLELTNESSAVLRHPLVGGVVLFARNFESRGQLEALVDALRTIRSPRLLITVDQEGGRVQRFRDDFTRLPAPGRIGDLRRSQPERSVEFAYWHGRVMAAEMLDIGIDLSFAPVLDLDRGSEVIGDRSFCAEPGVVVELGRACLAGMHDAGMKTTGKHFPGHGSVRADSHVANVCDERSLDDIESSDLVPFTTLKAELDAVMIAHVVYPCMDDRPAGYSRAWLGDYLRERIRFRGMIFSDDLGMHAAKALGNLAERTLATLGAGCNAALVCRPDDVSALLAEWDEDAEVPDTTGPLGSLYGLPAVPRGTLRGASSEASDAWREWKTRLERLG